MSFSMRMGMGLGAPMSGTAAAELATPVITRTSPGVYTITSTTGGASIYYTTNGGTPTANSTPYTEPLSIIHPTTLKAIAIKDEISSEVAEMVITESVWTIASDADGTNYVRIQCATTGQTLTAAGGAEIKLGSVGTMRWGTSVVVPSGDVSRYIYYRGNGTGGTLTFPNPENITYLRLEGTGTSITGSVTGMPLTYLYLSGTDKSIEGIITGMPLSTLFLKDAGTSITGTITEMKLNTLYLSGTDTSITGSVTGMPLTYLYLSGTDTSIEGIITGMKLNTLYLKDTGTSIDGVPPALGNTLYSLRIIGGTTYDYPWTSQTFDLPKRTWTASSMEIDCLSTVGVVEFNTWLLGLASVSNPGTATLILKNTPTIAKLNAAGYGEKDKDSGYYAMTTTLGYTLTLGT